MIDFVIYGEPASKSNSRKIVTIAGRPAIIKSKKALDYERDAIKQIPPAAKQMLEGELVAHLWIYYASQRPDLDESVILDVLQAKLEKSGDRTVVLRRGVYVNDRQVREKHVYHFIDKLNPRVKIRIESRNQGDMLGESQ